MSFLIPYTVWSALFLEKENKKNEYIAKLERRKRRKKSKNNRPGNSIIEKTNKNMGTYFNCTKISK